MSGTYVGVSNLVKVFSMVLLDSHAKTLMLGQAIMEGLGLTNDDLEPYSYYNITLMGWLKQV